MAKHRNQRLRAAIGEYWMTTRPDERIRPHDIYYIELAVSFHAVLKEYPLDEVADDYRPEDLICLCVVLAAWFEDYISEIGIWDAFRQRCLETIGTHLPFMDRDNTDYAPDYINIEDLEFIIWAWFSMLNRESLAIVRFEMYTLMAYPILQMMEERIENAPATSLFDEYLTINEGEDFFLIREKVEWLALKSYLFGILDLRPDSEIEIDQLIKERKDFSPEDLGIYFYETQLTYVLDTPTRFGGLRMPHMAARIMRGPQESLDLLKSISLRFFANFHVLETGDDYHLFGYPLGNRVIKVSARSVDIPPALVNRDIIANIMHMGSELWVQGALLSSPGLLPHEKPGQIPYILATPEEKKKATETIEMQKEVLDRISGGRIVVHRGKAQAEEFLGRFLRELQLEIARTHETTVTEDLKSEGSVSDLPGNPPICFTYIPGQGLGINIVAPSVIDFLRNGPNEEISDPEEAFVKLIFGIQPTMIGDILEECPLDRLDDLDLGFDLKLHYLPLCWFADPRKFIDPQPAVTLVDTGHPN